MWLPPQRLEPSPYLGLPLGLGQSAQSTQATPTLVCNSKKTSPALLLCKSLKSDQLLLQSWKTHGLPKSCMIMSARREARTQTGPAPRECCWHSDRSCRHWDRKYSCVKDDRNLSSKWTQPLGTRTPLPLASVLHFPHPHGRLP